MKTSIPTAPQLGRLCALLAAFLLAVSPLSAKTKLIFPQFSQGPGTVTGVAFVNPASQNAQVTLTAYGEDGQALAGIDNPAKLTVKPRQQKALTTTEIFGNNLDLSTIGWFEASSNTDGLNGLLLFLNLELTQFDGADLPSPGKSIIFNLVKVGSGESTQLNIINPSDNQATFQLRLTDGKSTLATKTDQSLPAKGMLRLDVATFFQVNQVPPGAYVRVDSDVRLAGFELVRQEQGDLLALNAEDVTEGVAQLFFPQFAVLGPWTTELGLINYSDDPLVATISAFKPDGSLYGIGEVQSNPVSRSLTGEESLLEDLETLFGFSGAESLQGWIRVEATAAGLNGFISYGVPETGSLSMVPAAKSGSRRAIFSHIETGQGGFFTGIAILNPAQLATDLRILAMKPDGTVLGSHNTVLRPGHRISSVIDALIPGAANQSGGLIWIRSDTPVYAVSLFGSSKVLANTASQPAPDSYKPDAGLGSIQLTPSVMVLPPNGSRELQLVGSKSSAKWRVDGVPSGNATVGTISGAGVYQAPDAIPPARVVTVTAEVDGQVAGASIDILEKTSLLSSERVVQSVAYLGSLQRLYSAELAVLSGVQQMSRPGEVKLAQQGLDTEIIESDPFGGRRSVRQLAGEKISKMIPYSAPDGKGFLLLAAQTSGRVLRLDPASGGIVEVATGLNQPVSLVVDQQSGDLLVVEQDKVSVVSKPQLQTGLSPQLESPPGRSLGRQSELFQVQGGTGIAIDNCTGRVFLTDRDKGNLIRFSATQGLKILTQGLKRPSRLLALYREGVACPDSFQLLVFEEGAGRVLLVGPNTGVTTVWVESRNSTDLAFLEGDSGFLTQEGVLLAEPSEQGGFQISAVEVEEVYEEEPPATEAFSTRYISVPNLKVNPGQQAEVGIELSQGEGISYIEFSLDWDYRLLKLDEVQAGSLLTDHQVTFENFEQGFILVVIESPTGSSLKAGSGSLVKLTFSLLDAGVSLLLLDYVTALDTEGFLVRVGIEDGALGDRELSEEDFFFEDFFPVLLSAPYLPASPGGQVAVPIELSDGSAITALVFEVEYDPGILRFVKTEKGTLLTDHSVVTEVEDGLLYFEISSPKLTALNPDYGSLVELVFEVVGEGVSPLYLDEAYWLDTSGFIGEFGLSDGEVAVSKARALSTASRSASPGQRVSVPLELADGTGISDIYFFLVYDPAVASLAEIRPGNLVTDHFIDAYEGSPGEVEVGVLSSNFNSMRAGSGTVAELVFDVLGPGVSPVLIGFALAFDTNGSPVNLLISSGALGADGARALSVPNKTAFRGETVNIPVTVNEGEDIAFLLFALEYDPNVLTLQTVTAGTLLDPAHSVDYLEEDKGFLLVEVDATDPAGMASGQGSVVELTFKVDEFGTSFLFLQPFGAIDIFEEFLPITGLGGSLGDGSLARPEVARSLILPELEVNRGDRFQVPVTLLDGEDLTDISVLLAYDPEIVSLASVSGGDLAIDHELSFDASVPGLLLLSLFSPTGSSLDSGSGEIANLTFDAITEGYTFIDVFETVAFDVDGSEVEIEWESGFVDVFGP